MGNKGQGMIRKWIQFIIDNEIAALIIVGVVAIALYLNIFPNDFCIDDNLFIVNWPMIQDLKNWPMFFSSMSQPIGEEGVYSPLKTVVHALNYHFFGLSVWGYHVFSIIVHFVGTMFAYRLSFQLAKNRWIAFLSGIIFAIHPVHVEAITSMTGSVDTLGIVFFFISFSYYIRFREGQRNAYWTALFFSMLAIFTHELTIVLPLLFCWYDICFSNRKEWQKILKQLIPFFVIALGYVILKHFILGTITRGGYLYGSFYLTMMLSLKVFLKYVVTSIFPWQLSINPEISAGIFSVDWQFFDRYAVLSQSLFDLPVMIALGLMIGLIVLGIRLFHHHPVVTFGIGFFMLSLLPVSNIIPLESYYAERYLYPASLGFSLCLAYGVYWVFKKASHEICWIFLGILIGLMGFYIFRTVERNQDWRNEETLYYAESVWNSNHPIMLRNLGVIYLRQGRVNAAIAALQKANGLRLKDRDILFALGEAYAQKKYFKQAIDVYEQAILADTEFAEAYYNIAGIYHFWGEKKLAEDYLEKAIFLYRQRGDTQLAKEVMLNFTKYSNKD